MPKIMYEISAHFINYLPTAILPQSIQTADAAMSTGPVKSVKKTFIMQCLSCSSYLTNCFRFMMFSSPP